MSNGFKTALLLGALSGLLLLIGDLAGGQQGLMVAFAFVFRLSIGLLEKIGPFFMVDPVAKGGLGLSNEMLGLIYGTYGLIAVQGMGRIGRSRAGERPANCRISPHSGQPDDVRRRRAGGAGETESGRH